MSTASFSKIEKGGLLQGLRIHRIQVPYTAWLLISVPPELSCRLIDLSTGRIPAKTASDNPQISAGPDILTRIHFADQDGELDRLNKMIIDGLNRMIIRLCDFCKIKPYNIYSLSVAGNTAMIHFFMGLSPHWIIREPYIPVINRPGLVKAKELELRLTLWPEF